MVRVLRLFKLNVWLNSILLFGLSIFLLSNFFMQSAYSQVTYYGVSVYTKEHCVLENYSNQKCKTLMQNQYREVLTFPKFDGDISNYSLSFSYKPINGKVKTYLGTEPIVISSSTDQTVIEFFVAYSSKVKVLISTKDNWKSVEALFFSKSTSSTFHEMPYSRWFSSLRQPNDGSIQNFVKAFEASQNKQFLLQKRGWGLKKKKRNLDLISLFTDADRLERKGIHLKKISADFSTIEALIMLTKQNYECGRASMYAEFGLWPDSFTCSKDEATIVFTKNMDGVVFNCHNFNICNYSLQEVAQMLKDRGVIKDLKYTPKRTKDGGTWRLIEKYLGRGKDGDELIVCKGCNPFNINTITISLAKSAMGDTEVEFN